ncbi:MAG: STAS domain-containing protein [Bryobacterales bacterium]
MEIPQRTSNDVLILEPAGRMTIGEADYALKQAVTAAADDNVRKLLLNLEAVTYMDSAALGELLASRQTMTDHGGDDLLPASARLYAVETARSAGRPQRPRERGGSATSLRRLIWFSPQSFPVWYYRFRIHPSVEGSPARSGSSRLLVTEIQAKN